VDDGIAILGQGTDEPENVVSGAIATASLPPSLDDPGVIAINLELRGI